MKHKTFLAYDLVGVKNKEHSNYHTFRQLYEWQKMYPDRFDFLDLQNVFYSSDNEDMVDTTVKSNLLRIMEDADNLVVVASSVVDVDSPMLNWMISRCVNRFHLPVIVCYAGLDRLNEGDIEAHWSWVPQKIKKYIGRDSARMCHIPLTRDKLERAIEFFGVKERSYPWNSTTIF